jgi:uncharacterized membrane protein YozB (DUF420 family)
MMSISDLPAVNATLNFISAILLLIGRIQIKNSRADLHKKIMITALCSSALFLISYLIYHGAVGSVPYERFDWTRPIYFAVLIPHIILAVVMAPFIILAVYFALRKKFDRHRRLVQWVWPVWMFVSVSGIVVYLMLYHL